MNNSFKKEEDQFLKIFYLKNLENIQGKNDQNLYSFGPFKEAFQANSYYESILETFITNFKFVETLLTNLLDRILKFNIFCPKFIKFICTTIYELIKEKFPHLDELTILTFVNKFFFEILLIQTIKCPEQNELISNEGIFDEKTHLTLNMICSILTKLSKFQL